MKISKLKYVFAFMLMVVVATLTNNAKAVTMPNNGQITISTIIANADTAIQNFIVCFLFSLSIIILSFLLAEWVGFEPTCQFT